MSTHTEESFGLAFSTGNKTLFQESKSERLAKIRSSLLACVNLWQEKQQERALTVLRAACYRLLPSPAKIHSASQKRTCFQCYKM